VLKELDKRKHLAEKKRLLYVALTRAKYHVILSALLNKKKNGEIALPDDSYLAMVASSLGIDTERLFEQTHPACIGITPTEPTPKKREVEYIDFAWKPLTFKGKQPRSATQMDGKAAVDLEAAQTGTTVHRIIELYWHNFQGNEEAILDKMQLFNAKEREKIKVSMARFYESEVYEALLQGAEHYFELEFNEGDMTGFIDLVYFDKVRNGWVIVDFKTGDQTVGKEEVYQKQLDFYAGVMERNGADVVEMRLLWV
jgi:ATP-dependent exoDNAse (exonuclease V) beta subunit